MKLGLGLYRALLTEENFRFARQAGATHIVAHLTDYFASRDPKMSSGDDEMGWGLVEGAPLWTYEEMAGLVASLKRNGLELAALENLNPAFWGDVLLDGPARDAQMEGLKRLIRDAGRAGVPCIGYTFNLPGVWGWTRGPYARGGAMSVGFKERELADPQKPIPNGLVWNMRVKLEAGGGFLPKIDHETFWARYERFLKEIMPVAEEAGVILAAHPDDPPLEWLRGQPRLITHPDRYDRMLAAAPSPNNRLELCLGTVQEMAGGSVYDTVRKYASRDRIGYIHFRNVKGKVPDYAETFVDEGDIDMGEIIRILADCRYDGVLIPDHTPELQCAAPWHAGMAYAMGYIRALIQEAERGRLRQPERKAG